MFAQDTIVCKFSFTLGGIMKVAEAEQHFGTRRKLAEALGITSQAVAQWGKRGQIPEGMAYKLQVVTEGALKVNPADYIPVKQMVAEIVPQQ
jgi:DNA-binding transcriptional regulator YdaS (Cro superfamily)